MAKRKRHSISLETKLAATLGDRGEVPYEHQQSMGDAQMISLYHFDHNIRHSEGGTDDFWNLRPVLIQEHRQKTATVDQPAIAKNKRLQKARAAHTAIVEAKSGKEIPPSSPERRKSRFGPKGNKKSTIKQDMLRLMREQKHG